MSAQIIPILFLDGPVTAGRDTNGATLHEVALPSRTAVRPVLLSPGAMPGMRQCLPSNSYCPAAKGTRGHSILGLLIGFKTRLAQFFSIPRPNYSRRWDSWEFWRSVLTGRLRRNTRGGRLVWLLQVNHQLRRVS
jgi:hypothetical protein